MWPFGKRTEAGGKESLESLSAEVHRILDSAFDHPGALYNEQRRQIMTAWFQNMARNIDAAAAAIKAGQDMRGQSISRAQVAQGLIRMCDQMGQPQMLTRLDEVCGAATRNAVASVLENLKHLATGLA